jgi:hypothetical protein
MYRQGTHHREISTSSQKNGEFFNGFTVDYIDRNKNSEANKLAKNAAHNISLPANVFSQTMSNASIKTIETEPRVINIIRGKTGELR